MSTNAPHVFEAISAITKSFADIGGIEKTQRNSEQKYNFRGIDDVYNHLAPMLPANSLVILPKQKNRIAIERMNAKGDKKMFNVALEVDFIFKSLKDNSEYTITMFGEATDYADKATNKAASAAYKYAIIQTFCIPVEGDDDADKQTPDNAAPENNKPQRPPASFWNGTDEKKAWATATDAQISEWTKMASSRRADWLAKAAKHLLKLEKPEDIVRWKTANARFIDQLGPKQKEFLLAEIAKRMSATAQAPLPASGEEPSYDTQTGEVYEEEIPGDFSTN